MNLRVNFCFICRFYDLFELYFTQWIISMTSKELTKRPIKRRRRRKKLTKGNIWTNRNRFQPASLWCCGFHPYFSHPVMSHLSIRWLCRVRGFEVIFTPQWLEQNCTHTVSRLGVTSAYNKHNASKLLQVSNWKLNYKYFLTKSDQPDKPVSGLLNVCAH